MTKSRTTVASCAATLAGLLVGAFVHAQPAGLVAALPNLTYALDGGEKRFALRDGRYANPAERVEVRLLEPRAFGDLDGDGFTDAAVILVYDGGGSGRFVFLAPVLNTPAGARALPAVLLGDRVPVRAVRIEKGEVQVTLCERAPGAPMASRECRDVVRGYALNDERLESVQAAQVARQACIAAVERGGGAEPSVEAQRYVGGPIWVLQLVARDGTARRCTYNTVTRQAEID